MKKLTFENNRRDFYATCSDAKVIDTEKCLYKHVQMFGDKTLIFWKDTGRISTREGHVNPIPADEKTVELTRERWDEIIAQMQFYQNKIERLEREIKEEREANIDPLKYK